jgi:hypothetical protein
VKLLGGVAMHLALQFDLFGDGARLSFRRACRNSSEVQGACRDGDGELLTKISGSTLTEHPTAPPRRARRHTGPPSRVLLIRGIAHELHGSTRNGDWRRTTSRDEGACQPPFRRISAGR